MATQMLEQACVSPKRRAVATVTLAFCVAVAASATSLAGTSGAPGAHAAKHGALRPDLVVKSVSPLTPTAQPGQSFTATYRVKNVGRANAASSLTRFYLETPRARQHNATGDWYAGARKVPALKPGQVSRAMVHLKVPVADQHGIAINPYTYYVAACADGPGKIKELKEGNNCRFSSSPITVTAAGVNAPPPPATSYPGLQGSGRLFVPADTYSHGNLDITLSFNSAVDAFEIWVPGQTYYASIRSPTYAGCSPTVDNEVHNGRTYTELYCGYGFPANTQVTVEGDLSPAPTPGMGGYLYGYLNGPDGNTSKAGGPFTLTGP